MTAAAVPNCVEKVVATLPLLNVVIANKVPENGVAVSFGVLVEVALRSLGEGEGGVVMVALTSGTEKGVKGMLLGIVKFQSRQMSVAVSEHGVGYVILGQNSDVGMSVGIPPELPIAPDVIAVLLVVDFELSIVLLVVEAVALASDEEVAPAIECVIFELSADDVVADTNESEAMLAVCCVSDSFLDTVLEVAEMVDELDHPVVGAEVWMGEKMPVLLPRTTVMMVGEPVLLDSSVR